MSRRKSRVKFDNRAIRDWMLYVVRLDNSHYYVGITGRKDFMRRIRQHGGRTGAKVNRGHPAVEIVELQHIGKTTGLQAGKIENDYMLQYRKQYGAKRVRGGYEVYKTTGLIPAYTPGSPQAIAFITLCLALAVILLIAISNFDLSDL